MSESTKGDPRVATAKQSGPPRGTGLANPRRSTGLVPPGVGDPGHPARRSAKPRGRRAWRCGGLAGAIFVAVLTLNRGGAALAQGDVLFPGSTVQGEAARGEGVAYKGAAVLYLNAAKARSIDADIQMRFNEYVYRSYQEHLRQRAQKLAGTAAKRSVNLAEVQKRLREAPTESDIASGDALNVLVAELANPAIPLANWDRARTELPDGAAATAPFQYASSGGVLSLRRLKVGDSWPVALRYRALEPQRLAYERASSALLDLCRHHALTPEAVEAVGLAARDLKSKAAGAIPASSAEYRKAALRTADLLEGAARALTRSDYVEDLLAELDGFRGAAVADLIDLMRRYNLHFAPADSPEERGLYQALYPLLTRQLAALGATPQSSPDMAVASKPAKSWRAMAVGTWKHSADDRAAEVIEIKGDGSIASRFPGGTWKSDGPNMTLIWPRQGGPAKLNEVVIAADGKAYEGKNDRGWIIRGVRVSED